MKRILGVGLVLSMGAFSVCASADEVKADEGKAVEAKAVEATAGEDAMRAYVDPETGALTSQPPAGMKVQPIVRRMELIEEIKHDNGMTEWKFNGQANELVIATVGKDGEVHTHCSDIAELHDASAHAGEESNEK